MAGGGQGRGEGGQGDDRASGSEKVAAIGDQMTSRAIKLPLCVNPT